MRIINDFNLFISFLNIYTYKNLDLLNPYHLSWWLDIGVLKLRGAGKINYDFEIILKIFQYINYTWWINFDLSQQERKEEQCWFILLIVENQQGLQSFIIILTSNKSYRTIGIFFKKYVNNNNNKNDIKKKKGIWTLIYKINKEMLSSRETCKRSRKNPHQMP